MRGCSAEGVPCRLIIYADELVPGNPYRPEKARTVWCVYWAFADWPQWLLQRSFAWPVFGIIRTDKVNRLQNSVSHLMRRVLKVFFNTVGHSMQRGIVLPIGSDSFHVTAIFAGFLGDLAGHKEILQWKGASGKRVCHECANLISNYSNADAGDIPLTCSDLSKFGRLSNEAIYGVVDDLGEKALVLGTTKFKELQTEVGYNHCPSGLLLDRELRPLFKPAEHCLRDWMHTLVGDGSRLRTQHVVCLALPVQTPSPCSLVLQYPLLIQTLRAFRRPRFRPDSQCQFEECRFLCTGAAQHTGSMQSFRTRED